MIRPGVALGSVLATVAVVLSLTSAPANAVPSSATGVSAAVAREVASTAAGRVAPQTLSGFDPGNLIEDAVFFAKDTMSAAAIQAFLSAKVPNCQSGYVCLKDFAQATATRPADAMCRSTYAGAARETAAQIIYKVAQACGINSQVLLVTLQKEQGLVTHTWPSDWRYTIAMGQGCPDTAACDTAYYGFFNQVYGAARQFKRYANPPGTSQYFTWYAPGHTWNVRFHPNAACGSSPVFIRNQATANLYYYTPYQPNAAALRAGYATANDGCSSYGNRNFYNYFTDWFGSTRATNVNLVRSETDPTVYLVSGTKRYRILDAEDYSALHAVFGPTFVVGSTFISGLTDGGVGGAILRNESTGEISLVQARKRHRLDSCDLVAKWGSSCTNPVNVSAALMNRIAAGPALTGYAKSRASGMWVHLDSSSIATPLWDVAAVLDHGKLTAAPPAVTINTATLAARRLTPLRFAPAQLVRTDSNPQVYLTDDYSRLLRVGDFADVAEYGRGAGNVARVSDALLNAGYRAVGDVAPIVTCGGVNHVVAGSRLIRINDAASTGLGVTALGASTCAMYPRSSATIGGPLFVKSAANPTLFHVVGGVRRVMPDMQTVVSLNGGTTPTIVVLQDTTIGRLPLEPPIPDATVAKSSTSPIISLVSGTTLHAIPSFALAAEIGLPMAYRTVPQAFIGALGTGVSLSHWVVCGGQTYFGAGGTLRLVSLAAAAGFTPAQLSDAACALLAKSSDPIRERVFVQAQGQPDIYLAEAGTFHRIAGWATLLRLGGGSVPPVFMVSGAALGAMPKGAPIS